LTLSSTREQMLGAMIESLAAASAERLPLLAATGTKMRRNVILPADFRVDWRMSYIETGRDDGRFNRRRSNVARISEDPTK